MFAKILVPIDPNEAEFAGRSVEYAAGLAKSSGAGVRLIGISPLLSGYVTEFLPADYDVTIEREASQKLALLAEMAKAHGADAEIVIRIGSVYTEVIEEAKAWDADLIVVSSHRPSMSTYFLGSNAAQIVRHALCSVLVLRD
jgi:nucleotide-binding universal stress UspA family protein